METDNKVVWDFYLIAAPGDMKHAKTLRELLNRGGKAFLAPDDIQPGADIPQAKSRAIAGAGLFVVLCGSRSRPDGNDREELVRAVDVHGADPNRYVVPVRLSPNAINIDQERFGIRILHPISVVDEGSWDNVATKLIDHARKFRAVWERKASIAIVCCHTELKNDSRMAAEALRKLTGIDSSKVHEHDSEDPQSLTKAIRADNVVVLVGVRTGGTDVLEKLVDHGAILLRREPPDLTNHFNAQEIGAAHALGQRTSTRYPSHLEVGKVAADEVSRWLRDFSITRPGEAPTLEEWEVTYLTNTVERWRRGSTGPLQSYCADRIVNRSDYYVPLRASKTQFCWAESDESVIVDYSERGSTTPNPLGKRAAPRPSDANPDMAADETPESTKETKDPWLERVVSHSKLPYLVLEGEPGSGKSVLLQHIACALAHVHGIRIDTTEPEETRLDLDALRLGAPLIPIPILVEAQEIEARVPHGGVGEFVAVVRDVVHKVAHRDVPIEAFKAGLARGRYLILVDSLDEVTSLKGRQHIIDVLGNVANDSTITCRAVLTTRPVAHTGVSLVPRGFEHMKLAPVDMVTAGLLVSRWAKARGHQKSFQDEMWKAVHQIRYRHNIETLVENPLLLVCALLVYEKENTLPESTADLYYRMVDTLCTLRDKDSDPPAVRLAELRQVFFILQSSGRVEMAVHDLADRWADQHESWTKQDRISRLDRLYDNTGLLRFFKKDSENNNAPPGSADTVKAWHKSFQEYFSATALTLETKEGVDAVVDRLFSAPQGNAAKVPVGLDPFWTGTIRFVVGTWGSGQRARAYVQRLVDHVDGTAEGVPKSTRPGHLLGLAAAGIAEYGQYFNEAEDLKKTVQNRIVERFEAEGAGWTLADRLLALDELGRIGDPRLERDRWVELSGGPFVMGGDKNAYNSAPAHTVTLAPFQMARCPVTVWDYAKFINDGGYVNKDYWAEFPGVMGQWTEPEGWTQQKRWSNRPVVGVSWFETMAYCAWLRQYTGLPVRLPTEAEWEYAAKAGHQGDFPWKEDDTKGKDDYQRAGQGDEARANYDWGSDSGGKSIVNPPNRPTPVGAFPKGNNQGMVDLAGNVWEWCLDAWKNSNDPSWQDVDNPCHQGDIQAGRAVRGGSWVDHPWRLRCALRYFSDPDFRYDFLGFRVLLCGFGQHALKIEP